MRNQEPHVSAGFPSKSKAWFVWGLSALFYLYQLILRNFPGVMTEDLMRDFSVEACGVGILTGVYLLSYSSLQIPVGLGMDKFGPARLLRGAILLCCVGTTIFAVADSFYLAAFGRLLIGAGATCAFLGSVKLGTLWFPPEHLALVVGVIMIAATAGGTLGQAPLALLVEFMGWRQALLYVVVPVGILLAIGVWVFVKDGPKGYVRAGVSPSETTSKMLFVHLKDIVIDYRIWAIGGYGALMYLPMLAFIDLWGISFLTKLYGIDRATAGSMTTMFYIGVGVGSPLVAIVSDFIKKRKMPMVVGGLLSLLFNGIAIYVPGIPPLGMYLLLFAAGVSFSSQPLVFSAVCQLTPLSANGTVTSFINMIVMVLGLLAQPLVGWFLDFSWSGEIVNGAPYYTVADYRLALLSVPLSLLFALFMMLFIPETFPQHQKKPKA